MPRHLSIDGSDSKPHSSHHSSHRFAGNCLDEYLSLLEDWSTDESDDRQSEKQLYHFVLVIQQRLRRWAPPSWEHVDAPSTLPLLSRRPSHLSRSVLLSLSCLALSITLEHTVTQSAP